MENHRQAPPDPLDRPDLLDPQDPLDPPGPQDPLGYKDPRALPGPVDSTGAPDLPARPGPKGHKDQREKTAEWRRSAFSTNWTPRTPSMTALIFRLGQAVRMKRCVWTTGRYSYSYCMI
jgi:hypothetical protein